MSRRNRRTHSPEFKASIALESLRKNKPLAELARDHDLHPNLIIQWRRHLLEHARDAFDEVPGRKTGCTRELEQRIQQLTLDNDFLAGALSNKEGLSAKT